MESIRTGDRIKYYRNLLHLTQKELAMDKFSPKMIYLLENNKKRLTPVTASILVSNFNDIANEKGVKINLEIKDLLMSDEDYANTLCNKWLEDLEEGLYDEAKYLKVIQLAKEYNLKQPILKACKKVSSYYCTRHSYSKALPYFEELLPLLYLINSEKEKVDILNHIATCYYMLPDYNKAFSYYSLAYEKFLEFRIIDSSLENKLLFNLALCSIVMENHTDALIYIEKLERIVDLDESEIYTNLIVKANIYLKIHRTQDALDIYKDILKHDIKYLYIVQHNMAVAFMQLGRLDESIEFFTKSINNQIHSLSLNTTISFVKLAEVYYKEKKYEEAYIFYGYGYDNAKKFNQLDELLECYENICMLSIEMNKINKFNFYYASMKDLCSNVNFDDEQYKKIGSVNENYISHISN